MACRTRRRGPNAALFCQSTFSSRTGRLYEHVTQTFPRPPRPARDRRSGRYRWVRSASSRDPQPGQWLVQLRPSRLAWLWRPTTLTCPWIARLPLSWSFEVLAMARARSLPVPVSSPAIGPTAGALALRGGSAGVPRCGGVVALASSGPSALPVRPFASGCTTGSSRAKRFSKRARISPRLSAAPFAGCAHWHRRPARAWCRCARA